MPFSNSRLSFGTALVHKHCLPGGSVAENGKRIGAFRWRDFNPIHPTSGKPRTPALYQANCVRYIIEYLVILQNRPLRVRPRRQTFEAATSRQHLSFPP